jgi:YD repeat-containing protein
LIQGLADEKKAKTSMSSAFGEYEYDQYGNPVYETWPNGDEVYEVDEEGHAIPYTGIKLMYVDA